MDIVTLKATTVPPPRILRAPRGLDYRALFGVFLTLVATGGSIAFWGASSDTRAVVVTTRDRPAGERLTAADLATVRVRVDEAMYRAAIPASEMAGLEGRTLAEPVHAHQLLVRAQVAGRSPLGPDQLALSIPISPDSAGARLRPGDAVQVLATIERGKPESQTYVVLPRVSVYAVGLEERLTVVTTSASPSVNGADPASRGAGGRPTSVTLAVSNEQARELAWARWNAELDVALLPPPVGERAP